MKTFLFLMISNKKLLFQEDYVKVAVKALCCKPEGREFKTR
jgi:hypothetical protein